MPLTAQSRAARAALDEAARLGRTKYRTGQPCRRGHLAERYVTNGVCVACQREYLLARRGVRGQDLALDDLAALVSKRARAGAEPFKETTP